MNHELKVTILNCLKAAIYQKSFIGATDEDANEAILFLTAFILLLKNKDLQLVPFQFELILNQPLLDKFGTNDWEALLLLALDMHAADKVIEEIPERAITFGMEMTPTELAIAILICKGLTDHQVMYFSFKNYENVRKHHHNINIKLGVHNQIGLFIRMVEMGHIPAPKCLVA